jgi:hypothetical protein
MLRANSILPSFMVWDKEIPASSTSNIVLHVTLKPTDALYDHVLVDGGSVDTVEDLNALASARPYPDWALPPGILFRVLLLKVKETNTLGFIISGKIIFLSCECAAFCPAVLNHLSSEQRRYGRNIYKHVSVKH